jgi:hypothetical protein
MLHRELLCNHSPYFHKAFKGDFRESDEKEIHLPDVTASIFSFFKAGCIAKSPEQSQSVASREPKSSRQSHNESGMRTMSPCRRCEARARSRIGKRGSFSNLQGHLSGYKEMVSSTNEVSSVLMSVFRIPT